MCGCRGRGWRLRPRGVQGAGPSSCHLHKWLLRIEQPSVCSGQLPSTSARPHLHPEQWTRPQRGASWPCASAHGRFLVDRRPEGVAEPWFGVCPPPPRPQPTALVTSLLGAWSTAAPGSSLSTSPDGVAGPQGSMKSQAKTAGPPTKTATRKGSQVEQNSGILLDLDQMMHR